jgi:hypothetical protein
MSKKIMLIALCSMLIAVVLPVEAQQPGKVPRIGFLSVATPVGTPCELGLRDLGCLEDSTWSLISIWRRQAPVERVGKRTCPAESGLHCCAGSA